MRVNLFTAAVALSMVMGTRAQAAEWLCLARGSDGQEQSGTDASKAAASEQSLAACKESSSDCAEVFCGQVDGSQNFSASWLCVARDSAQEEFYNTAITRPDAKRDALLKCQEGPNGDSCAVGVCAQAE